MKYLYVICVLFVQTLGQQLDNKELGRFLIGNHVNATYYTQSRTDISTPLQNALDTLSNEGGGKVIIAPGLYYISRNIQIGSNTQIDGYGIKITTIQLLDFAPMFSDSGMLRCIQSSNVTISNMTINGNKYHQNDDQGKYLSDTSKIDEWYGRYGIYIEGANNMLVDNVYVSDFQLHGIVADGNSNTLSSNISIRNSFATYNDFDGIFIDKTVNVSIVNTTTRGNGRTGYNFVATAKSIVVDGSYSFKDGYTYPNGPGCGIQLRSIKNTFQNITIANSLIVEPKDVAICLNKVNSVNIENNNLYAKSCVEFKDSSEVEVIKNLCMNPIAINVIQPDDQNVNITIIDNIYSVGNFLKQNTESLVITIGYSNTATHVIQQGANAYPDIQQSLDDIKINGGGVLKLEAGTYFLSSYIEVGSNTAVIGAGVNDTVLRLMDWADPWWIPNTGYRKSGFIRSTRTQNLYFANITIDGNKNNQHTDKYSIYGRYGFFTEAVDNVTVDSIAVINFQGYGFDPHGVKETMTWSKGLTIRNSYSYNNGWDGYTIDQSTDVVLENNVAYNNGRHGFNIVTGSYNVSMNNNVAYENGFYYYHGSPGCGIAIQNNLNFGTKNISVMNSIFENNDDAGICIKDVADIILENNTIANINYTNSDINLCIKVSNSVNVINNNNICNNTLFVPIAKQPIIPKNTSNTFNTSNASSTPLRTTPTSITSSSDIQLPSLVITMMSIILTVIMI